MRYWTNSARKGGYSIQAQYVSVFGDNSLVAMAVTLQMLLVFVIAHSHQVFAPQDPQNFTPAAKSAPQLHFTEDLPASEDSFDLF